MQTSRILLIHRHAGTRASVKKGLAQRGCEVIMGFSAASAANILKLEDIRAALVDLRTPACSALELVHRLRHIRPNLAVFGLADTPSKFEIDACRQAGLQGYFTAPFNPTAMANAIEKIEMTPSIDHRVAVS